MRKFVNDPADIVRESLAGLAAAHADLLRYDATRRSSSAPTRPSAARSRSSRGGGSGHEPLHGGFVGRGMLDAACPGEVFTSPVPDQMLAATKAVDGGAGVVHIVKNYTGDVMNFKLAAEDAADEGIDIESVLIDDDVAVQDSLYTAGRRGVGATVLAEKLAGAAAEAGGDLARSRGSRARSTSGRARSASRCRRARRPPRASRSSTCPRARWRSASASTASPAGAASGSAAAARSPRACVEAVLSDRPPGRGRRGARVRQRDGRHAAARALRALRRDRAAAARRGAPPGAQPRRQLHHVARDGGRVADAARARRGAPRLWDAPVHTPALRWGA